MVNFLIPFAITMIPVLAIFLIGTLLEYYLTGKWLADTELLPMCIKTMVIVLGAIYIFDRFAAPSIVALNVILMGLGIYFLLWAVYLVHKEFIGDVGRPELIFRAQYSAVRGIWLIVLGIVDKTNDIWVWATTPTIMFIIAITAWFIRTLFSNWEQHQRYMGERICLSRELDLNLTKEYWDEACPWYRHHFYKIVSSRKGRWPRYRYNYDVYCLTSGNELNAQLLYNLNSLELDDIKSVGEKYKSIKAGLEEQNVKILFSGIDHELHRCCFKLEMDSQQYDLYSMDCLEDNAMNVAIWDYFPWEEAKKILGIKQVYS